MPVQVDVIVPVYNAPELTQRCLTSLARHLPEVVSRILVHDNQSNEPTRNMLANLSLKRVEVHTHPVNLGFGQGVNFAASQSQAEYLLFINSDTEAKDDFLSPMLEAMETRPKLAAVIPFGNTFHNLDRERYDAPEGLLPTHHLHGYAFLMRRALFEEMGGFDPVYGLGYFEDTDLGLSLLAKGHQLALCLKANLHHEIAGSFGKSPEARALYKRNEQFFHDRFPQARERVLMIHLEDDAHGWPQDLHAALKEIFVAGGKLIAMGPMGPKNLPAYEATAIRGISIPGVMRQLASGGKNPYKRITRVWIGPGLPKGLKTMIATMARAKGLEVQEWS